MRTINLAELPSHRHELNPFQYRRLERWSATGITQVQLDPQGNVVKILARTKAREQKARGSGRHFPHAYYGICLGLWLNLLIFSHLHVTALGWVLILSGQLLVHEAWPRRVRRHRKTPGDRAAEKLVSVL